MGDRDVRLTVTAKEVRESIFYDYFLGGVLARA